MIEPFTSPLEYPQVYYYSVSLLIGAVVNWLMAFFLAFDLDNFLYTETPRYLRARYLTALNLAIFGLGFFVQWWYMPRFTHPLSASALALAYFHIGGTLFSFSHTGLIDRHYLTRRVVVRDLTILFISLCVYAMASLLSSQTLLYVGFALFFLHCGSYVLAFYRHFHRMYLQLGTYAEYMPNDTDRNMRWLFFSCHLIILFGIGSIIITLMFPHSTLPYTLLMAAGIGVFAYIFKVLDNFRSLVFEAEEYLRQSEEYLSTDEGRQNLRLYAEKRRKNDPLLDFPLLSGFIRQWDLKTIHHFERK